MSDILSQDECDALLNAVAACDVSVDAAEPSRYDYGKYGNHSPIASYMTCNHIQKVWNQGIACNNRIEQYSKAQLRLFMNLFEEITEKAAVDYSKHLNKHCELELVSIDELTTSEFLMSVSDPCCLRLFKLPKATDCGIYEIGHSCLKGMAAVDATKDIDWASETLTREEAQAGEYLGNLLFAEIAKAFNTVASVRFKYADKHFIRSPRRVNADLAPSHVLLVSLEARLESVSGLVSLALPQSHVNFLMLTQNAKQTSDCPKDKVSEMCVRCRLLQEYLRKEFPDLKKMEADFVMSD